jgi:hypothetical protein
MNLNSPSSFLSNFKSYLFDTLSIAFVFLLATLWKVFSSTRKCNLFALTPSIFSDLLVFLTVGIAGFILYYFSIRPQILKRDPTYFAPKTRSSASQLLRFILFVVIAIPFEFLSAQASSSICNLLGGQ